jgi:hypothetical protein
LLLALAESAFGLQRLGERLVTFFGETFNQKKQIVKATKEENNTMRCRIAEIAPIALAGCLFAFAQQNIPCPGYKSDVTRLDVPFRSIQSIREVALCLDDQELPQERIFSQRIRRRTTADARREVELGVDAARKRMECIRQSRENNYGKPNSFGVGRQHNSKWKLSRGSAGSATPGIIFGYSSNSRESLERHAFQRQRLGDWQCPVMLGPTLQTSTSQHP